MRLLCYTLLIAVSSLAGAADWHQWRGPLRTGFDPDSPPLRSSLPSTGLEPLWTSEKIPGGSSGGWSSPIATADRVFIYAHTKTRTADLGKQKYPYLAPEKRTEMSEEEYQQYEINRRNEQERRSKAFRFDETVYCLDRQTGETVWKQVIPSVYSRFVQSSTPALQGDRLLMMSAGRVVRCLDASNGEQAWETRLSGEFRDQFWDSSIVVAGRVAVVLCGQVSAIDIEDGKVLWQGNEPADSSLHSSPVIWHGKDEALVMVNVPGGKTVAYALDTGEQKWTLDTGAGHSSPLVVGDLLLTYGKSRKSGLRCYRLSSEEPEELWKFQRAADPGSSPVVADGNIYIQGERRLACVDLETGKSQWQTMLEVSNPRYTSIIAGGDQAFYAWEGVLAFSATPNQYQVLYDAKIDSEGRLIQATDLRKRLNIGELESTPDGLAQAEKLWQREAIQTGPLRCATPVLHQGHLIIRLRDRIVCYDLRTE